MHALFFKHILYTLGNSLTAIRQKQNARAAKVENFVHMALLWSVPANASTPVVALNNFALDSCWLEAKGEGDEFRPHQTNVLTVRTPFPFINADDWSACVLDGMGEIVSIRACDSGIQITYMVGRGSALALSAKIYVSIFYRGISVFSAPVEICQGIFKNTGRLAFRAKFADIIILNDFYYLMDVFSDGSVMAFHDVARKNARICEILGSESECGEISYQLSSIISNINGYRRWNIMGAGSMIVFLNTNELVEVSFDGVVVRVFPFVNAYAFDICEAADCMAVSFTYSTDIVIAQISTGEILHTIQHGRYSATVRLSPCGQLFSATTDCDYSIHIHSVQTGKLIKHMKFENPIYVYQFASDDTMLIYNYRTKIRSIINISTGKECDFLPDVDFGAHKLPFIRGPYAYVVVDGNVCVYE
jgi:hypothetical protein